MRVADDKRCRSLRRTQHAVELPAERIGVRVGPLDHDGRAGFVAVRLKRFAKAADAVLLPGALHVVGDERDSPMAFCEQERRGVADAGMIVDPGAR